MDLKLSERKGFSKPADNAVRIIPRMRSAVSAFGESAWVRFTILEV